MSTAVARAEVGLRPPSAPVWGPLASGALVQAVLLFCNIGLLTMWTDEAFTVDTVVKPLSEILRVLRGDIHPPLYFLVAHFWIRMPLGADVLDRLRMLSACWTLAATVALDRLWLARLRPLVRYVALGFWCLSPTVLLYGRMARSYSMQVALALLAIALVWRFMQRPTGGRLLASAASVAALFYTHYVPALAITATFGAAMAVRCVRRRMPPPLAAAWAAAILAAYFPWAVQFREAIARWSGGQASATYALTGSAALEHGLKLAYSAVSFTIGESFPVWALGAAGAIAIAACVAAPSALRKHREFAMIFAAAAVLGYLGVAHWASYPFIPARMLWVLPFFGIAFASGVGALKPKSGAIIAAIALTADGASIASYYSRTNFLNKGYAVPLRDMAAVVRPGEVAAESLVLMDGYNTDYPVLERYLPASVPHIVLNGSGEVDHASALLKTGSVRHVWVIANAHDISPEHATSRIRLTACAGAAERRYGYVPFDWWERRAMTMMRVADPPAYFYEIVECSR